MECNFMKLLPKGANVESVFLNSADEIARKIDQNYYDLENDSCGIKQGIKRQNNNPQVRLGKGGQQQKGVGSDEIEILKNKYYLFDN